LSPWSNQICQIHQEQLGPVFVDAVLTKRCGTPCRPLLVGVLGGISGNDNIITMQGVRTGIGPVADPYADASFPNFFGCSEEKFTAKSTITINPGVYCGGIGLNAGANVTLNPASTTGMGRAIRQRLSNTHR
jgi:hypothetical protein